MSDELGEVIQRKRKELNIRTEDNVKTVSKADFNVTFKVPQEWYKCKGCGKEAILDADGLCYECQQKKLNTKTAERNSWKKPIIEELKKCNVIKLSDIDLQKLFTIIERINIKLDFAEEICKAELWLITPYNSGRSKPKRKNFVAFLKNWFLNAKEYKREAQSKQDFKQMYEKENRRDIY